VRKKKKAEVDKRGVVGEQEANKAKRIK